MTCLRRSTLLFGSEIFHMSPRLPWRLDCPARAGRCGRGDGFLHTLQRLHLPQPHRDRPAMKISLVARRTAPAVTLRAPVRGFLDELEPEVSLYWTMPRSPATSPSGGKRSNNWKRPVMRFSRRRRWTRLASSPVALHTISIIYLWRSRAACQVSQPGSAVSADNRILRLGDAGGVQVASKVDPEGVKNALKTPARASRACGFCTRRGTIDPYSIRLRGGILR
jgi:hypothetical protein